MIAPNGRKLSLLLMLALLLSSSAEMAEMVMQAMSNAYLAVTVFVVATMAIFYSAERFLKLDLGEAMARPVAGLQGVQSADAAGP